jgi:hypothetical protein
MMTVLEKNNVATEFSDLPFGEKLVLWAVRIWVQAIKQEANAQTVLRAGFARAGAPEAHPALDDLMTIIATSAQCGIDVRCPKCSSISPDEQRLLGAISAWQNEVNPYLADSFLSAWIPPSALRIARTPTAQLAQALKVAGIAIRPRAPVKQEVVHEIPQGLDEGRPVTVH